MIAHRSIGRELALLLASSLGLAACSGRVLTLDDTQSPETPSNVDAGPSVEKLPLPDESGSFWVDDTRLYWQTESQWLRSCLHEDCDHTTISYGRALGLVGIGENVIFWSTWGGGGVSSCPKTGCENGALTWVVRDPNGQASAVSGDYYYWSSAFDIFRCPSAGCGEIPEVVARGESPWDLKLAGSRVYWSNIRAAADGVSELSDIRSAPQDGSEGPTTIATISYSYVDFAVDTRNLYWIDQSFQVVSCPLETCQSQSPTPLTSNQPKWGLTVDASGLYWLDRSGGTDVVMHCPLGGCSSEPQALTTGHVLGTWSYGYPYALDSTYLYWQERRGKTGDTLDTRSVRRMRKPTQ